MKKRGRPKKKKDTFYGIDLSGDSPEGFDLDNESVRDSLLTAIPFTPFKIHPLPRGIQEIIDAVPKISEEHWPEIDKIENGVEAYYRIPPVFTACLFEQDGKRGIWVHERKDV